MTCKIVRQQTQKEPCHVREDHRCHGSVQWFRRYHSVDLRTVELDVSDQASVDTAVCNILTEAGRLDVVVYNAGHTVLGPTEAFTPEQLMSVYDTNVVSTQRLNRATLPHLRAQGDGLIVWVGSEPR